MTWKALSDEFFMRTNCITEIRTWPKAIHHRRSRPIEIRARLFDLAEGLIREVFWIDVYPTEVVKSEIQVDDYKISKYHDISAFEGVEGVERFWSCYGSKYSCKYSMPCSLARGGRVDIVT
ncbi:hypothetical protein POM88_053286 [Heracleum sosnowskyi]|uniref:Uncharacterized protein n=1 Tax=Heracleum sosnowskyi TaxID=360622 RepID=A0AAD8GQ22_9APIA|nr:hypothetical protein POM88_053286 [Heracleum sosnowskyi]